MQSRDITIDQHGTAPGSRVAQLQRLWRLVGLALLLALPLAGSSQMFAAPITTQAIAISDPSDSLRPQVAADSKSNLHMVWHEGEGTNNQAVKYAKGTFNGAGYSWSSPFDVYKPGGLSTYIYPRIAIDRQDQIHITFTFGGRVFYKRWPAAGTPNQGTTPQVIGSGVYPSISAGDDNRIHVVWEQVLTDNFEIIYREFDGTQFSPERNLSNNTGDSLNPDIAVDTNGAVHVVWYDKSSGIKIQYARRVGTTWQPTQVFDGNEAYFPSISADRVGCVHIAWAMVSGGSAQYRKHCNGQVTENRAAGTGVGAPQVAVGASAAGRAVVTWTSKAPGIDNLYYALVGDGNATPQQRLAPSSRQFWPDAAGLPNGQVAVVWQEDVGGRFDPAYTVLNVGPPPPKLTGSLTINGGTPVTKQAQVPVTITNTSASAVATAYSLADGVDPGTPNLAFSNPSTSTMFTLNTADRQCREHTIYAKLGNQNGQSATFSGKVTYDGSADALVEARNPNLPSNPPLNDFNTLALPTGNIAYTRRQSYNLGVSNGANECSGLKRYALAKHGAALDPAAWHPIPAEGYVSRQVNFTPDRPNGGQGTYQYDVYVEDNIGNVSATPYVVSIVYDITGPTVSGASGALATTSSPKGGVVAITTAGLTVDDNLYLDQASGRKYWGYWVVVKKDSAGPPREDQEQNDWARYGVVEAGPVPTTLSWNMARGLVGGIRGFTPGRHTVYIRYLDGAGNWSNTLASQSMQVNQLELFQWLPLVRR